MAALVGLQESRVPWEAPLTKPLDEAVWQAWVAKGRARDRQGRASRMKAVRWISIAGLIGAAALWSNPAPYDVVVKFVVAVGAIIMMFETFYARQYAFAVVFAALVVLFNPVASVFSFAGDWQRGIVAASAVPFLVAIMRRDVRLADND